MPRQILITLLLPALALGLTACEVKKTQEGQVSVPKYKVEQTKEGSITPPKYEVKPADVNVGVKKKSVEVPSDVQVQTKKETVDVPTVSVTPADKHEKKSGDTGQ